MGKFKQSLTTLAFIKYYNEKQYQTISDTPSNKFLNAMSVHCSKNKLNEATRPICQKTLMEISNNGIHNNIMYSTNCHTNLTLSDLSIIQARKRLLGEKWYTHNMYLDGDFIDTEYCDYIKLNRLKIYREIKR